MLAEDRIEYETLYEGRIVAGERGIILADTHLTELGARAYRDFYASQAPYRRAAEVRRRFERDFGGRCGCVFWLAGRYARLVTL